MMQPNCLNCTSSNGTAWECVTCNDISLKTDIGCKLCSELINSNCTRCRFNGSTLDKLCTQCSEDLVAVSNACVPCQTVIADCDLCVQDNSTLAVQCAACGNGKVVSDDSFSCRDPSISTIIIISAVVGGVGLLGISSLIFIVVRRRKLLK
jgi:hypothetical protein